MMSQVGSPSRCARSAPVDLRSAVGAVRSAILTYFGRFAIGRFAQRPHDRQQRVVAPILAARSHGRMKTYRVLVRDAKAYKTATDRHRKTRSPAGWRTPMSEKPY